MKKFFYLITALVFVVFLFLLYFTYSDYQPNDCELICKQDNSSQINVDSAISIVSWNIGYAGLDDDMDFFYDGGKQVRPTEQKVKENLKGIADFICSEKNVDFFLLQEIDSCSKRSYYVNQIDYFKNILKEYNVFFAKNYDVQFVPQPISDPMGKVVAGLATYSRFVPYIAHRYAFPFNFKWPLKVFMLDRCFLETRFKTNNGKELVIINTHNSAFDDNGSIRKAELSYFSNFILNEYKNGNYIIVTGDFNQSPFGLKTNFEGQPFDFDDFVSIPDTLFPSDWHFVFDNNIPTNRRVVTPYKKGETKVTLIDFFITSPNVQTDMVECKNLNFEYSDHNPIYGRFKLIH